MARKSGCLSVSYVFIVHMMAVALSCAGLVVLQHFCMNHRDRDFVDGYCLTDSHMRAVLAAILTAVGLVLSSAVSSSVESYRSAKLATGINEGVYIAMASQSLMYRLYALSTPWAAAVALVVFATNAPNSIQTLANLGIKTAGVYVRNPSVAYTDEGYAYYNASVSPSNFSPDLSYAIGMMVKMRDYRNTDTSTATDRGVGAVTSVVRDGYLRAVFIVDSDATNAFKHLETVVTITSTCTSVEYEGLLSEVLPANPDTLNVSIVIPSINLASAFIYDVKYAIPSDNSLVFKSSLSDPECYAATCTSLGPETPVVGSTTTCTSLVVIQDQEIIYTVGAESVAPIKMISNSTTVSVSDLGWLMAIYAKSIESTPDAVDNPIYVEAVQDLYANFPAGRFNLTEANVLHTKLCAASSLVLDLLYTNSGVANGGSGNITTGNGTVSTQLYSIVQLTYISTTDVIIISVVITGFALVVCLLAIAFAFKSRINVKPATDSSLLYNADPALIAKKQALMSELSNDPRGQMTHEFESDSVLYCRELAVDFPNSADPFKHDTYCRVNISYSNMGALPHKSREYC